MTHSAPSIAFEVVSVPNQSFFAWLRTQTALFVGQLLALIGAVGSIAALAYYVGGLHVPPSFLRPPAISTFVIYSHLVFLTIFIIWLIKGLDDNKRGLYRARRVHDLLIEGNFADAKLNRRGRKKLATISTRQVRAFKLWFLFFWGAMLLLYIVFTIEIKYSAVFRPTPTEIYVKFEAFAFPFLTFLANNVSMFLIFGCFVALYLPAGRKRGTQLSKVQVLNYKKIVREYAEHRSRQAKLLWRFGILLGLFTLAYPVIYLLRPLPLTIDNWNDYPAIFNALSGTLNAVVVALLIARLDSKLIGLPPWLISILYFYSGIQPMFVVFEQQLDEFGALRAAVLVVVFIFKLYFFLIIFYSLQEGRLLNYFYCSPLLNQHIRSLPDNVIQAPSSPGKRADVQTVVQPASPESIALGKKLRPLLDHEAIRSLISFASRALNDPAYLEGREKAGEILLNIRVNIRGKLDRFRTKWRAGWPLMVSNLLGWFGIIYFVFSLLYYARMLPPPRHDEPWLYSQKLQEALIYAHFPLLLIIIGVLIWVRWRYAVADAKSKASTNQPQASAPPDAKSRLIQFQRFFLIFWCLMFAFYVFYAIKLSKHSSKTVGDEHTVAASPDSSSNQRDSQRPEQQHEDQTPLAIFSGGSGNIVFTQVFMAKADIDHSSPAAPAHTTDQKTEAHPHQDSTWTIVFSVITFLLNNLMVLFVFLCFSVLYLSVDERHSDKKYKSLRNYAILVCCLITVVTPLPLFSLAKDTMTIANPAVGTTVIAAVGGVLNAVAFALLFARLDSRLIRLPTSVISILYVYAALQPLFVVFERGTPVFSAIETSALMAAFIFKICFVLVIFQALTSGTIEYHLKNFPSLNTRVNSIFDNQYEIRMYRAQKQFKYSIFKKDAEVFRAEDVHDTREECETAVMDLMKLMGDKANYDTAGPVRGTYWVQIMGRSKDGTKTNKPLCESKDFSSLDDVKDLIAECVEKVPYCKYSRV